MMQQRIYTPKNMSWKTSERKHVLCFSGHNSKASFPSFAFQFVIPFSFKCHAHVAGLK